MPYIKRFVPMSMHEEANVFYGDIRAREDYYKAEIRRVQSETRKPANSTDDNLTFGKATTAVVEGDVDTLEAMQIRAIEAQERAQRVLELTVEGNEKIFEAQVRSGVFTRTTFPGVFYSDIGFLYQLVKDPKGGADQWLVMQPVNRRRYVYYLVGSAFKFVFRITKLARGRR